MHSVADTVNSLGLILDIVGVILLFRYGLPPADVSRTGAQHFTWGYDKNEREKGRVYVFRSRIALVLLVTGFAMQIVSNHL
ncbi:MAG: hypothetical protein OXR67_08235 [Chloroflexota bacterium]|nr:hypothetical protein [Chloroflexota bacterium]